LLDLTQFTRDDIMRGVELLVMGLLGLIVMFFVVRPLVRRIVTPDRPAAAGAMLADGTAAAGANGAPLPGGMTVAEGSGPNVAIVGGEQNVAISNHTSAMIDIAKVAGQVHAQS